MKSIEIFGEPDVYLLRTWLLPSFFGCLLVIDFFISHKINYSIAFSFLIWLLIVISIRQGHTGIGRKKKYTLEFGKQDLTCKFQGVVFWHIPYTKLSHATEESIHSGSILFPKRDQFLIYTKEGDSYSLPIQIPASQVFEIKDEIDKIKNA